MASTSEDESVVVSVFPDGAGGKRLLGPEKIGKSTTALEKRQRTTLPLVDGLDLSRGRRPDCGGAAGELSQKRGKSLTPLVKRRTYRSLERFKPSGCGTSCQ